MSGGALMPPPPAPPPPALPPPPPALLPPPPPLGDPAARSVGDAEPPTTDVSADTFTVTLKSADTITFAGGAALDCNFDFSVAGDTATLVPGQTCMITVMGINLTVTPSSASMMTSDGMTATLNAQGSVDIGKCTVGLNAPAATKM